MTNTLQEDQAAAEADLDAILLGVESRGDGGLQAVKHGEEQFYPADHRQLSVLETRGLIVGNISTHVGSTGVYRELTYRITPAGRMRCAEIRLAAS